MTREEYIYSVLNTKTITLRIPQELYDNAYNKIGLGETISDVFRKAISEYVKK